MEPNTSVIWGTVPADEKWILIYDPNFTVQRRYIKLAIDGAGHCTSWYYKVNDLYDWGTDYQYGWISYTPYSAFEDVWKNGPVNSDKNMMSVSSKNYDVKSVNGNTIAQVRDGKLIRETAQDVTQQVGKSIAADGSSSVNSMLYLPSSGKYVVKDNEPGGTLSVGMANVDQASIAKAEADEITIQVSDSSNVNSVMVDVGSGKNYSVKMTSALASAQGKELVEVNGKGTGKSVSVSMVNGTLDTSSATGATIKINGKVQGANNGSQSQQPAPAAAGVADGQTAVVGGATYLVKSNAEGTVYYHKAPKSKKSVTVPATVAINGKTYRVVGISAKAFAGTKAKTVTIKTAELTKASVKKCFKGAKKVKTVKVKAAKGKANKKLVKKYRKYFAKGNSGKKVTVK